MGPISRHISIELLKKAAMRFLHECRLTKRLVCLRSRLRTISVIVKLLELEAMIVAGSAKASRLVITVRLSGRISGTHYEDDMQSQIQCSAATVLDATGEMQVAMINTSTTSHTPLRASPKSSAENVRISPGGEDSFGVLCGSILLICWTALQASCS